MELFEDLIKLSKIFKKGFTVELKNNELNQYTNYKKPYIVSYKTIITVKNNKLKYQNFMNIPDKCIIGGWYNNENNTYYIELNKAYSVWNYAIKQAKLNNQTHIFDIKRNEAIRAEY